MSDRALATTQKQAATRVTPSISGFLQRKCACGNHTIAGGECEACNDKKGMFQRAPANESSAGEAPPIVHDVLRSPGRPLDVATRAFMEPRFAYDFSQVRVHTDAKAAESARAVNALAYTVGNDIVLDPGVAAPAARPSKILLAHELTHVVQQSGKTTGDQLALGEHGNQYEQEADRASKEAARSEDDIGRMRAGTISAVSSATAAYRGKMYHESQPNSYSLIQRQTSGDDEPKREFPPDFQHGAPTRPVSPDPHVAPAPGTKPEPEKSPYRSPAERPEYDKQDLSIREKIANALKRVGIPPWAAAAMVVLVIAALADPEPFTKVALIIGLAAAVVVFAALGRQNEAPPAA